MSKLEDIDRQREQIHQAMAIEMMEQLSNGQNNSSSINRMDILNIIEKIKEKQENYILCHKNLKDANEEIISNFTEQQRIKYEPIFQTVKKNCDFDIPLFKIGECCGAWRERKGIVAKGSLFSSKTPLSNIKEFDINKVKDKTKYLDSAIVNLESKENKKTGFEWQKNDYNYRIVIEYIDRRKRKEKKKIDYKQIILYFHSIQEMDLAKQLLFGGIGNDDYLIRNLNTMQKTIDDSFTFYGILKLISVKEKIKKRKRILGQLKDLSKQSMSGLISFGKNTFSTFNPKEIKEIKDIKDIKDIEEKIEIEEIDGKDNIIISEIDNQTWSGKDSEHSKEKIIIKQGKKKNDISQEQKSESSVNENLIERYNNNSKEYIPSFFNPIITSLPLNSTLDSGSIKNINDDDLFKSSPEMINKINKLNDFFPNQLNDNEDNANNVDFMIKNRVIVENNDNNYKVMNEDNVKNANGIKINKVEPSITFYDNKDNKDSLNSKDIYNISNIILNCKTDLNGVDNNNLVILGPKKETGNYYTYRYLSQPNIKYCDPAKHGLKYNNFNSDIKNDLICLQIFQLKYKMDEKELDDLIEKAKKKNININKNNPEEDFYFYHTIEIGNDQKKKSDFQKAKLYKNEHFIVEFNNEYYFLPEEIEEKPIKVKCYCIPKACFSNDIDDDNKKFLVDYMNPYNLGETEIIKNDIEIGKNEYSLFRNNTQLPESTTLLVLAFEDNDSNKKITKGLKGKDYSIGNETYLVKTLNKTILDKATKKINYNNDIKSKYYEFECDDEDNILFRPREDMPLNDFVKDIENQVNEIDLEKIKFNQKYNFIPQCEKFVDRNTLYKSKNLSCLTDEEKNEICINSKKGDWIYKAPEIKVRMLSKNLGVNNKSQKLNQYNYFTFEDENFNHKDFNNREKMYPITENNFNILDMTEINNCENLDKHKWKISIKFNNENQMKTFVKEIQNLKQKSNLKIEEDDNSKSITYDKTLEHCKIEEYQNKDSIMLNIESILFNNKCKLNEDSSLEINGRSGKNLLELLKEEDYDYENSLLTIQEVKDKYDLIKDKAPIIPIKEKEINAEQFNSENQKIFFKTDNKEIPIRGNKLRINILLKGKSGRNNKEYFSQVDISKKVDYNVCPIYLNGNTEKIYGILVIDTWAPNIGNDFDYVFIKENKDYITKSEFYGKDKIPLSHGFYEPNVFRRKILKIVSDNKNKEKEIMNRYIKMEYAKDYDIDDEKFDNVKRDNDPQHLEHSYNTYLGVQTLKNQKIEEFFDFYAEKEWNLYIKDFLNNNGDFIELGNLDSNFQKLLNKKEDLFKNEGKGQKLRELMYLSIPSKNGRKIIWETLLEIHKLFELTDEKIPNEEGIGYKSINGYNEEEKRKENIYYQLLKKVKSGDLNIIFSLIDNDVNYIQENEDIDIDKINEIKFITKTFYLWTEKKISINEKKKEEDIRYVYFSGVLSIVKKLSSYFKPYETFWMLIGLSQFIDLFQQQNPFYMEDMNYLNLCVLVTKLILECHYKDIYDKFLSLNYPIEFFISQNINSLFSNYFPRSLTLNMFDILIYESTYYKQVLGDRLQYLRILCTIPITLISLKKKDILECQSVSELEIIIKDMIVQSYQQHKFIDILKANVNKFFQCTLFDKFCSFLHISSNRDIAWDMKRDDIEKKICFHFNKIREENIKIIDKKIKYQGLEEFYNYYQDTITNKLSEMNDLYDISNPNNEYEIVLRVNKLKPLLYQSNINITNKLNLDIVFSGGVVEPTISQPNPDLREMIEYDNENFEILNLNDLFFKKNFGNDNYLPKFLNIIIRDDSNNPLYTFCFNLERFDIMKIDKIVLESLTKGQSKFLLEIILFKNVIRDINSENFLLFNTIFDSPKYYHNLEIENKLNSYDINQSKEFEKLIKNANNEQNLFINPPNDNESLNILYKKNNNRTEKYDNYNEKKNLNQNVMNNIEDILKKLLKEDDEKNWFSETDISFEEILYIIVIIDSSIFMISKKIHLLFRIAQMRSKLLFKSERASIDKIKEMIYILYKRFMIYFNKNDINRMIDFMIKDEKLYNIKYAFIYNSEDEEEINKLRYDSKRYNSTINEKNLNDKIIYDNIIIELNAYINYFANHYNMKSIPQSIVKEMLKLILKGSDKFKKYKQNNLNSIKLVISKDNIEYELNYEINYKGIDIIEKMKEINPKNEDEKMDKILCKEMPNLEIVNSYEFGDENDLDSDISFYEFKKILFKLPFLSDLFRISLSHMSGSLPLTTECFNSIKIIFTFNDIILEQYTFSKDGPDDKTNIKWVPTKMNCIYDLLEILSKQTSEDEGFDEIKKNLFTPNIFECKINNNDIILPFESFYSNQYLNENNDCEIRINYIDKAVTFHENKLIRKNDGYCKIFFNKDNFEWKKGRITEDNKDIILKCLDYKLKYHALEDNLIENNL